MPTVIFPNGKIITLDANNKCGISTVQSYLGYPFFLDMRGRNGKFELKEKGLWFDKHMGKNFVAPIADHSAAVIRDPVKRMTSIYTDRVVRKNRENCKQEITSWELFVNELPTWQQKYKDILIHSMVQADVLSDTNSYDKIFNTNELSTSVRKWISKHAGVKIPPHKGKDGRGASEAIHVTPEQEKLIKKYYEKDYEVFGNYFQ